MSTLPSNLNVRRARDADLPEMARIHHASYPGAKMTLEETVERFRTNPRIPLEDYWICEKDSRLVGLFALYKFQMYRVGKVIPAGGIGSVAVAPEARRERIAYWMMVRAVEIMDQNSVPLSILYPFRHSFYQHLGWGLIGRVNMYRFAPESLPNFPERESISPVVTQEDQETVMACYHSYAQRQNGMVQRDDPYWYEVVYKNAQCYAYISPDSGKMEGYVTFRYRPHPQSRAFSSTDIEVWDFVWNSRKALHGLLGFLASQRDQVKIIDFPDQTGLPFDQILSEPQMPDGRHSWLLGAETIHVGANLMGRIVQLKRALTAAERFGNGSGKVILKIADELNSANSEQIKIELDRGRLEFTPRGVTAPITLSTDISTFSSLYWGAIKLTDAVVLGKVELEGKGDAGFLKQMFDVPRPVCMDHF